MAKKTQARKRAAPEGSLGTLRRLTVFFFDRPRLVAIATTALVVFGVLSYTTLMRREGFPSINVPYASLQGVYLVNDAAAVDREVAKPLSDFLMKQSDVKTVDIQSGPAFVGGFIQYSEGVNAATRTAALQKEIATKGLLPPSAGVKLEAAKFGFTMRGDEAVVSFINTRDPEVSTDALVAEAENAVQSFKDMKLDLVQSVSIINPYAEAKNLVTGESSLAQQAFERYGERTNGKTTFYNSVIIGFSHTKGADALRFDEQLQKAIAQYNQTHTNGYQARLSASFGPGIRQQVSELQRTLLEGLIAVFVVGSLIIAVRASVITVLSMLMVLAVTLGVLNVMGHTLNTIILFALILGLSLIVDDTIIMVEAIDAQRRRLRSAREIVATAAGKVGRAMLAATLTAALSFVPLLFVGGVVGDFVREVPITIITALLVSLLLALVTIPLLARFIMLRQSQLGGSAKAERSAKIEAAIARFISAPMLWAQHSKRKLALVSLVAITISVGFVLCAGVLFKHVPFNIFPPSKDANQIQLQLSFVNNSSLQNAERLADSANAVVAQTIGPEFIRSAYYGQASADSLYMMIQLTDYSERTITAPEMVVKLEPALAKLPGVRAEASVVDVGPSSTDLTILINADGNREGALRLAEDVAAYLRRADIRRLDDSKVLFKEVNIGNTTLYSRSKGKAVVTVNGKFAGSDTSTMLSLSQKAVEKTFPPSRVSSYNLPSSALKVDLGQEQENQDSFKTMMIAFPLVLLAIYVLLAAQFRSFLQPLLIFLAIPFSLLGVTFGLWVTHNSFSFFAMLGFFALIGLSIKNTILLTDYANQARRAGMNPVDAAHEALAERFRPLVATSLTAMVSLVPLAVTSPFWQGLSVVLIFGLFSSTLLVVTVFPYYYLMGEFLRGWFRRRVSRPLKQRFARA